MKLGSTLPRLLFLLGFLAGCGESNLPSVGTDAGVGASRSAAGEASPASETRHFAVHSSADPALAAEAGLAAEALLDAYASMIELPAEAAGERSGFQLRLYATRAEFLANNRSRAWAEAYYVNGTCYAYLDRTKANPYQWLLHEVVHQLNRELTGYAREKWLNEGLATYLGSSRYAGGRIEVGVADPQAYPVLWLRRWLLSGDWAADVQAQRVIPLRALLTGQGGPPLDATVNAHYLGYWSLTHFLLHGEGGKYAAGYHHLVRHGGSLAEFERHVGPLALVERQWYEYLLAKVGEAN